MDCNNCLYFLRDPRNGEVRYVGISKKPKTRFTQHWCAPRRAGYGSIKKVEWFNELQAEGLKPHMQIVFSGLTRRQAEYVEDEIVYRWKLAGKVDRLCQFVGATNVIRDPAPIVDSLTHSLSKCSPACRQAVIEHFQQLTQS